MASPLARAHILGEQRLRRLVGRGVTRLWRALPGYDERDVDPWLARVLPLVLGGQRMSVALTEAYLARAMGRAPLGVNPERIIGSAARAGATPDEVYRRPFVTLWSALGEGKEFATAAQTALARAVGTSAMDMQLAMRGTLVEVGQADDEIMGFERVADDDACGFCMEVDGAQFRTEDAMPLHNHCGCGVEPVPYTRGQPLTPDPPPETVAIEEHGELGPVLGDPAHDFTQI